MTTPDQDRSQAMFILTKTVMDVSIQINIYIADCYVEAVKQFDQLMANVEEQAKAAFFEICRNQRLQSLAQELEVIVHAAHMMMSDMIQLEVEPAQIKGVETTVRRRINEAVKRQLRR